MEIRPIEFTKETEALIQQVITKYIDTTAPLPDSIRLKDEMNIPILMLARRYYVWNIAYNSGNGIDPNPTEMSAGFIDYTIKLQVDKIKYQVGQMGYTFDRLTDIIFEYDEPTGQYHLDIHFTATKP